MSNQPLFHNYKEIVENYIDSFLCIDKVFSYVKDDKYNPNHKMISLFFDLIDIKYDNDFEMVAKAMICARKGEILYFKYKSFINVAHYVLDNIPNYWTHFRLILKVYKHFSLIEEILNDSKVKNKIVEKQSYINNPNHFYNVYIEFLCPELGGRLIAWGDGVPVDDDSQLYYPINIFKKLLADKPSLPITAKNHNIILDSIRNYICFNNNVYEEIPADVLNVIFKYIQDKIGISHSKILFDYYGDFPNDIDFKNKLNPIIDVFDLGNFIEEISFCDNCCYIDLKGDKKINLDTETEEGWINFMKKVLLEKAIKFCEDQIGGEDRDFFIERGRNFI